jgi:nitroreductase
VLDLDQSIIERHSTRMFLPRPVPQELVEQALALAQHAPSNSNIQPWRLVFVSGTARDRLKDALFKGPTTRPCISPRCPLERLLRETEREVGEHWREAKTVAAALLERERQEALEIHRIVVRVR